MTLRGKRTLACLLGYVISGIATHAAPPEASSSLDDVLRWKSRQRIGITLPGVLRQALEESIDIEVDRYEPIIATARLRSSKGTFEPLFETSLNYTHRERLLNEYDATSRLLLRGVQSEAARADQLEAARLSLSQSSAGGDGDPSSPSVASELDSLARQSDDISRQLDRDVANAQKNLQGRDFEEQFSVFRSQITQKFPTGTRLELLAWQQGLSDSDLVITDAFGFSLYPYAPRQHEAGTRVRLTQPLLRDFGFGANMVGIRIARADKKAADADFLASLNKKVTEIIAAYLALTFAESEVEVVREAMDFSGVLTRQNAQRQKEGMLDIGEVRRAEAALAEAEERYLAAQNNALQKQNRLLRLTTRNANLDAPILLIPAEGVPLSRPPSITLQDMMAVALQERAEYLSALALIEKQKARFTYAKNQTLPRFDIVGSYGTRGMDDNTEDAISKATDFRHHEWFAGFQMSIPLGNSAALGGRDQAKALLNQSEALLKQVEANISVQAMDALNTCRLGYAQIEKAREAQKYAEETMTAESRKLEVGRTTTLAVLDTQRDLRRAQLRVLSAELDYQRALVALEAVQGVLLKKHNIYFDGTPRKGERPLPAMPAPKATKAKK